MLELSFLGSPIARLHGQALTLPTRKAWALLAYLACEPGMHTREKLAAMLWPDNDETGGRTALRKALGFLTSALEVEGQPSCLNASRDAIGFNLDAKVLVDVLELQRIANETRINQANLQALEQSLNWLHHEFLAGFTLPQAPDFEDWLEPRRESLRSDVDGVLQALTTAQAETGQPLAALATARRRVQLDTMNEGAHRAVIELHLQTGDRAAALEAYRTCQQVLEKELGIAPSSETEALAERARAGDARVAQVVTVLAPVTGKAGKPQAGMTAPFVGREREWTMLEDAWNDGLIAFVAGEPGSGKSRLMQEFMRTKQAFIALENRPGDAGVPYASLARHLRALLKSQAVTLEPWVNSELARILPECGEAPAPIQSEQGKLRFFQAIVETFQTVIQANENLTALLYDDAQFTDTSSSEATRFVLEQLDPDARAQLRILYGYRKNELPAELEANLKQTLIAGEGVLIELEPLPASALEALLHSLFLNIQPQDMAGISRTLEQFTGGNPLFVLETVKSLTESQHGEQWTAIDLETMRSENRLPKSSKVKQVIERRLERLSKPARDLVRVAAVMGQEYTLERAAKVLEADQLVLAEASEELEWMGIVRANRFTHDLIFEASYEGVPQAAKPLLHSRVLDALQTSNIPAAILARHANAAGRIEDEFRYSYIAGTEAFNLRIVNESIKFLERSRQIFIEKSDKFNLLINLTSDEISNLYSDLIEYYSYKNDLENGKQCHEEAIKISKNFANPEFELVFLSTHNSKLFLRSELLDYQDRAIEIATNLNRLDWMAEVECSRARIHLSYDNDISLPIRSKNSLIFAENALDFASKFQKQNIPVGNHLSSFRESPEELIIDGLSMKSNAEYHLYRLEDALRSVQLALEMDNGLRDSFGGDYLGRLHSNILIRLSDLSRAEVALSECIQNVTSEKKVQYFWNQEVLAKIWLFRGFYAQTYQNIDKLIVKFLSLKIPNKSAFDRLLITKCHIMLLIGDLSESKTIIDNLATDFDNIENFIANESIRCIIHCLNNKWIKASENAKNVIKSRSYPDYPIGKIISSWTFETECLLRCGEFELIRDEINRRTAFLIYRNHDLVAQLRSIATLNRFENHLDATLERLNQALEIAEEINYPREIWEIQSEIAHIHDMLCEHEAATKARSRAIEIRDSLASIILDETMRNTYLEFTQKQIDVPLWKWPETTPT